jgi:hypothetical protein
MYMYRGYPICLSVDGTVSVFRLKLELLEKVRLHEEVLPDAFKKICRAICEEKVLQDPVFIDEDSKVILDGMHRVAALLTLKDGECKKLFFNEETGEYKYPECEHCNGKFKDLQYILCCAVDYVDSNAVELKKWYRGVSFPLESLCEIIPEYTIQERPDDSVQQNDFAILTDGKRFFALSKGFNTVLEKYMALRRLETAIKEHGGTITYPADEEAYQLLQEKEFASLIVTPDITKKDVQTFSKPGLPYKGDVFPPKSTRHLFPARPLKINVPLALLTKEDYSLRQEQLKVFLRRKRRLTVRGKVQHYLEERKILFGNPGELREPTGKAYLWVCEFPLHYDKYTADEFKEKLSTFYEIKYAVDEFKEKLSDLLIQNSMEMDYFALIYETNRIFLIISNVKDEVATEALIHSLIKVHFPDYTLNNLFGKRDHTLKWMVPMEDYTPSRAYFERSERVLRNLVRMYKVLHAGDITITQAAPLQSLTSEDLLILFALHILGNASRCKVFEYLHEDIEDHRIVFARIDTLTDQGLITKGLTLSGQGKKVITTALATTKEVIAVLKERSGRTFSEFFKEIDQSISQVIKPDGRKDAFHMGSIMESLVFTDIGWRKVVDVLDMVVEELEHVDFASSDELTWFVQEYLQEKYPLTNIPSRYNYFINSRDHLFLKDDTVISLSRAYIEADLDTLIPPFLTMTVRQKSQLSNMVYEGIRLLTIPLIKELYEKERIVIEKDFFSKIEEFLVFQAVPILKKVKNKNKEDVPQVLKEILEKAYQHAVMSAELLHRHDTAFIGYYLVTMDCLTEVVSVALGRVPAFDVFGRLSQGALLARDGNASLTFLSVHDAPRFLRHLTNVFRRATSLIDQWRSGDHDSSLMAAWENHLSDVLGVVKTCIVALSR